MYAFFITRHVTSAATNLYWLECVSKIRQFYPENWIVIIDDNSNHKYLSSHTFLKCIIVKSEFPARGELLPYYYFLQFAIFDTAVILHDSVFVQMHIPFESFTNRPLWSFKNPLHHDKKLEAALLQTLTNSDELLALHATSNWTGCFGVMSVVTREFAEMLESNHRISNLLTKVTSRLHRCCLERVFGVLFAFYNRPQSTFGLIQQNHYMQRFNDYANRKRRNPIEKVWTGR